MHELARLKDEGLIRHLGTTNFDTDHLYVLAREGIPIATNQVCYSLLDRRAGEEMAAFCAAEGIRLLAYGTLAGGLLTEKWLGRPEPAEGALTQWSAMKYKRFVDAIGGWDVLQAILRAISEVATRHGVSMANVATRWVLDQPAVAAVIVGARLSESEHRGDNLRIFSFDLDTADRAQIDEALDGNPAHPRRLRQRISPAALSDRDWRPQPASRQLPKGVHRRTDSRSAEPAAPQHRQRLGADLRL